MSEIKYIELLDVLDMNVSEKVIFTCCDPSEDSFSVLRAQIQGDIYYSKESVRTQSSHHDLKCKLLLKLAKSEYIDLMLFPEYCISYNLLEEILIDKELWPDNMKLWCLPCEGISTKEFEEFVEKARKEKNVFFVDILWRAYVNKKKFVNACFYCFRINKDGEECLCLAPQFKTQHMSDPTCECETRGLTTGKAIFTVNHRLITLLCADALNNDIYWQDLQKNSLTNGLLLLHPQLNKEPKHTTFCRVRQEMQAHNHPGICITCNWAEDTRIIRLDDNSIHGEITLSWSCVYHKHQDLSFEDWRKKGIDQRRKNSKKGLFGAFMKRQHMEVWFSLSVEQAILAIIPNTISNQYGVTKIQGVGAEEQFIWSEHEECWKKQEFLYNLREILKGSKSVERLGDSSKICDFLSECYSFPFEQQDKYVVDCFFALTLHGTEDSLMTINEREEISDWTLLLDYSEYNLAIESLYNFMRLTGILQKRIRIPRRLKLLEGSHCFCYESSEKQPYHTNMKASEQKFLLVFAKNDMEAQRIKRELLAKEFNNNDYLAEKILGVVYTDIIDQQPHFLPEYSTEFDQGDNNVKEGDITNGRD